MESRLFITDTLHLVQIGECDARDLFRAIDDNRMFLDTWLPFVRYTLCEQDSLQYIRQTLAAEPFDPVFTIRENGAMIGLIGFKSTDMQSLSTEIGYWLVERAQGRGIVTRAVELLCRYAAERRGLRSVTIKCATGNEASNRIPRRLGFTLSGIEHRAELLSSGEWTDANVYTKELSHERQ